MSEEDSQRRNESGPSPEERFFTGSSTLLIMLLIFGVLAVMTFLATIGPPEGRPEGHAEALAYRPADFPEIFDEDLLAGLNVSSGQAIQVPPAPFRDPQIFPCSDCHYGDPGDPTRRELSFHEDIVLRHDEEHRWCLDCHLDVDRDFLHLADGTPVPFAESYQLCGQCHGHEFNDWRAGAHGKRVGYWDGARRYLLCVHCHDPHGPAFKPIEPLPPPVSPQFLRQALEPARFTRGGADDES